MNYKELMGYSKKQPKKKVVKEQKKPSLVDTIKQELNEFRGVIQSKMGQNKISKNYEVASINKLERANIQV